MVPNTSKIYINPLNIEQYRQEYALTNCVFLPGFLNSHTLQLMMDKVGRIQFETKYETDDTEKFGKVLFVPQNDPAIFTLNMLLNGAGLFETLMQITSCADIKYFNGRIHRSEEKEEHGIGWHGDNAYNRLLALTLSLGEDRFTGGEFQLREKGSDEFLRKFGQLEAGDALIFKIAPHLEHRLTTLQTGRRTVGVGWFHGHS